MNLESDLANQFINPSGSNQAFIQHKIKKVVMQLVEHLGNAEQLPSNPFFEKKEDTFFKIPDFPQTDESIQANLAELYTSSMNPANPQYIGHMDSLPSIWSVLGDFIASAINNNLLSLEMSPLLTQIEYSLTRQFAQLFDLPSSSGGVMLSGGTLSNLQALIVARNTKLGNKDGNLFHISKEPVLLASEHCHSSIYKAAMMIGIGGENIIKIKADENSKMDLKDLERQIFEQIKSGKNPFAIIATAGTTVTGNIDPLKEIATLAKRYGLWLHIDAIYGGAVTFSTKHKHLIKGIGFADSISFNPQKWLYVAKTCSMVLFRNFDQMVENFRVNAPYMKEQNNFINLGELSIQGTKHAEVLKLWLSLLSIGKKGYEELIDNCLQLRKYFEKQLRKRSFVELASTPELNIVCFRLKANNLKSLEIDNFNRRLQEYLLSEKNFYLSILPYKNKLWLRSVLLNPFFGKLHIKKLIRYIDDFAKENGLDRNI